MDADPSHEAAEAYFRAFERWDLETLESLVAERAVDGRPQSGERFPGRENILGMLRSLPSQPQIRWGTIRGGPRVWIAEGVVDYGEGPVHLVGIAELEEGLVVQSDYYFADPFDPPDYRVPFTEHRER